MKRDQYGTGGTIQQLKHEWNHSFFLTKLLRSYDSRYLKLRCDNILVFASWEKDKNTNWLFVSRPLSPLVHHQRLITISIFAHIHSNRVDFGVI